MPADRSTAEPARRLLLVHAHPDDETITTGATMARYAASGAAVTLITCTRGEQGEVIPADLAHLAAAADDTLGPYREGELAAAMAALGVTDHRFLDRTASAPDGLRYRDSGMVFDGSGGIVVPPDARPDAFALADATTAASVLAGVIDQVRPQVVVTYDPGGGYGHPDHVQAHLVTMEAVEAAAAGDWPVPKVYWVVAPESVARQRLEKAMQDGENPFRPAPPGPLPSMVVDDRQVTTAIDGSAFLAAKTAALRAHATQIAVHEPYFALSNGIGQPIAATEYFRLALGELGPVGPDGRESDLFAGLDHAG